MTITEAMTKAATRHGVPVSEVMGWNRKPRIVAARWEGWAMAVEAGHTRAEVARETKRDWTSVMHGVRRYNERKDK
jgi:chromosomal replication initiation ATPase DnaA